MNYISNCDKLMSQTQTQKSHKICSIKKSKKVGASPHASSFHMFLAIGMPSLLQKSYENTAVQCLTAIYSRFTLRSQEICGIVRRCPSNVLLGL